MTLSRETKIGLAVAGSFLCLVGAILAAQFCKSPPPTKETGPAVQSTTSTAKVNATIPEVPPPPTSAEPPQLGKVDGSHKQPSNSRSIRSDQVIEFATSEGGGVTYRVVINTSPPRVEDVVNGSENLLQLQSEYRRFWNKEQPPRVTAIHLPPSLSGPINFPNAAAPAPKLTTPLGSTQNPWDVSLMTPSVVQYPAGVGITF